MKYYVIISSKAKDMVISNSFGILYRFIVKHHRVKIKTIRYPGKLFILRKETFLTEFYIVTKDTYKLFDLVEILLHNRVNQQAYIRTLNLHDEYKQYDEDEKQIESEKYHGKYL